MKKYFPIGYEYIIELKLMIGLILFSLFINFSILMQIVSCKNSLFYHGKYIPKHIMPDYVELAEGSQVVFVLIIFLAIGMIASHYRYHYKGTKSIYTMKRLKNPKELHYRCLVVPVLSILGSLVAIYGMLFLNFALYLYIVPDYAMNEGQLKMLLQSMQDIRFYFIH